ncbi:hypothetical protein GCM10027046_34230 [Uliginosibacterium flavum]|uniref:Uncharacterized protein n=1 Tax=Uliginosibacterium flavum TaxID=1396831 RepID=A0ABV2TML6_9RHOO
MKTINSILNAGPSAWLTLTLLGAALAGANLPRFYEKKTAIGFFRLLLHCTGRFVFLATLVFFVGIQVTFVFIILGAAVAPAIFLLIIALIFIFSFSPMLNANKKIDQNNPLSDQDERDFVRREIAPETQDKKTFINNF